MRAAHLSLFVLSLPWLAAVAAPPKSPPVSYGDAAPQLVSTGPKWKNVEQLRRYAAQGDPQACFELGDRLLNGDGVGVDASAAREWLDRAARGGVAEAMFRLGKLHNDGVGGPRSLELALDYYGQAALLGVPEAQHNIGAILVSGRGVKRDYLEGLAWLIVAEKNGAASDAVARTRAHLAKRPADIAAAERRAAEILAALSDPAKRSGAAPRFTLPGARPVVPPPIAEPKPEAPGKVKVDLGPGIAAPKPQLDLPKS
jgi:uncharacterized protein